MSQQSGLIQKVKEHEHISVPAKGQVRIYRHESGRYFGKLDDDSVELINGVVNNYTIIGTVSNGDALPALQATEAVLCLDDGNLTGNLAIQKNQIIFANVDIAGGEYGVDYTEEDITIITDANSAGTNVLVVDAESGNDATGKPGSFNTPFATIGGAMELADEGDIIKVMPGNYSEATITLKGGVILFLEDGVVVDHSEQLASSMFVLEIGATAKDYAILGKGKLIANPALNAAMKIIHAPDDAVTYIDNLHVEVKELVGGGKNDAKLILIESDGEGKLSINIERELDSSASGMIEVTGEFSGGIDLNLQGGMYVHDISGVFTNDERFAIKLNPGAVSVVPRTVDVKIPVIRGAIGSGGITGAIVWLYECSNMVSTNVKIDNVDIDLVDQNSPLLKLGGEGVVLYSGQTKIDIGRMYSNGAGGVTASEFEINHNGNDLSINFNGDVWTNRTLVHFFRSSMAGLHANGSGPVMSNLDLITFDAAVSGRIKLMGSGGFASYTQIADLTNANITLRLGNTWIWSDLVNPITSGVARTIYVHYSIGNKVNHANITETIMAMAVDANVGEGYL